MIIILSKEPIQHDPLELRVIGSTEELLKESLEGVEYLIIYRRFFGVEADAVVQYLGVLYPFRIFHITDDGYFYDGTEHRDSTLRLANKQLIEEVLFSGEYLPLENHGGKLSNNNFLQFANNMVESADVKRFADNIPMIKYIMADYLTQYVKMSEMRYNQSMLKYELEKLRLKELSEKELLNENIFLLKEQDAELRRLKAELLEIKGAINYVEYVNIDLDEYPNAPTIVYLKEVSELPFKYPILNALKLGVNSQKRYSSKVLVLEHNTLSKRNIEVPDYYYKVSDSFSTAELVKSDFIYSIGNPTELLAEILENRLNLEVLFVYDALHLDEIFEGTYIMLNVFSTVWGAKRMNINSSFISIEDLDVNHHDLIMGNLESRKMKQILKQNKVRDIMNAIGGLRGEQST